MVDVVDVSAFSALDDWPTDPAALSDAQRDTVRAWDAVSAAGGRQTRVCGRHFLCERQRRERLALRRETRVCKGSRHGDDHIIRARVDSPTATETMALRAACLLLVLRSAWSEDRRFTPAGDVEELAATRARWADAVAKA